MEEEKVMSTRKNSAEAPPVLVEFEDGIAWVTLNRPEKRNAMNPALNDAMVKVLDDLELDERCGVFVLTGAGDSFAAGMDLREYFRDNDRKSFLEQARIRRSAADWHWRKLMHFPKPTIAMVNGWCFGGAFTPLVSCDLAIAANEAKFGVSEINWGIIPAGNVTRALAGTMNQRDALYYIMTGEMFDGRKAAQMGVVNESVPRARLKTRVRQLAKVLLEKNPTVLRTAKTAYKYVRYMDYDTAQDYLGAKAIQAAASDRERGRDQGLKQFLDDKTYRPGFKPYRRDARR